MKDEQIEKTTEKEEMKATVLPKQLADEYLANERTFLAWVRTSIAVITLGFIIPKFGLSIPISVGMMLFGGLLVVLAAWRYHVVNRQIERDEVTADRGLIVLIAVLVVVLSFVMAVYLLTATTDL